MKYTFFKALLTTTLLTVISSVVIAQEPQLEFEFEPNSAQPSSGLRDGVLVVKIQPVDRNGSVAQGDERVPIELRATISLFTGEWLVGNTRTLGPLEQFVMDKFEAFRTATTAQDFENLYDSVSYEALLGHIAAGRVDLERDRKVYNEHDNIRLLAVVKYGEYLLFYTQFRHAETMSTNNSVMTARYYQGNIVTAGAIVAQPDSYWQSFVNGNIRLNVYDFLEEITGN